MWIECDIVLFLMFFNPLKIIKSFFKSQAGQKQVQIWPWSEVYFELAGG